MYLKMGLSQKENVDNEYRKKSQEKGQAITKKNNYWKTNDSKTNFKNNHLKPLFKIKFFEFRETNSPREYHMSMKKEKGDNHVRKINTTQLFLASCLISFKIGPFTFKSDKSKINYVVSHFNSGDHMSMEAGLRSNNLPQFRYLCSSNRWPNTHGIRSCTFQKAKPRQTDLIDTEIKTKSNFSECA